MPPREIAAWRAPVEEKEPAPQPFERVLLVPFVERGLSLPLHDFVQGLLFFYGVQLYHFNANGIWHIECFIMLCECLLGTRSYFGMWKHLFMVNS